MSRAVFYMTSGAYSDWAKALRAAVWLADTYGEHCRVKKRNGLWLLQVDRAGRFDAMENAA